MRALYTPAQIKKALAADPARAGERPPFGPGWARRYLPHYFNIEPADFHAELFGRLRGLHTERDSKMAVIAPREGAKSTVITLAYVLHCAVEGHEPYTLILGDMAGQAQQHLSDIRYELETNPALAADYPAAFGKGPVWRQDRIELRNGPVVQALGTGGRVRGRRRRQSRPSLVIFDDVENNTTITSEAKRAKAWRWATREVIPAGTAGTNFLSVGSALHRECVAVKLGQTAGWTGHTHKAVHQWPDRMDLWARWERLATNLADPDRKATARGFYLARAGEMDAGAIVYWPQKWPLYALMQRRAEVGAAAFDTEYQGVPGVEGLCEWPPEWFEDRPGLPFWFDDWPTPAVVFRVTSLDPSKGGRADRASDPQAHILLAFTRDGDLYVEAVFAREAVPLMVARAIDLAEDWNPHVVAVETNEGLGMLVPEFVRQLRERQTTLPLKEVYNVLPKPVRIRRLGTYLQRGQVRFRRTPGTLELVNQLRDFPSAAHDDGPDALEMAVRVVEEHFLGRS